MRILIITDAWRPQVNGVVRTLSTLKDKLEARGETVRVISPDLFKTIPCPSYSEIRLALFPDKAVARMIEEHQPCAIHVATEGPLGWAARNYCVKRNLPFTTAYHTMFPEYVRARWPIPLSWSYKVVRKFHGQSSSVMVATQGVQDALESRGFDNIKRWTRGVDTELFHPRDKDILDLPRPIFCYVGRVAVEKNIEAFLKLDLPGSKLVVGDGPQLASLRKNYPEVHFTGAKHGEDLASHFAAADCFVFPSLTDTFGLVLLEALASGLPVAAYPVQGPLDVIGDAPVGVLKDDLRQAALDAVEIDPVACRDFALKFSWDKSVDQFLSNLKPFDAEAAFGPLKQEEPAQAAQ